MTKSIVFPDVVPTFRMPVQMAVTSICRGALTGWPQLLEALRRLRSVATPSFDLPLGTADGRLFGGPAPLARCLAADPGYLARETPPPDIHGGFVWLALRMYRVARTIRLTLDELPTLVLPATKRGLAANGALVSAALGRSGGLIDQARALACGAEVIAGRLETVEGGLQAARETYRAARAVLGSQPFDDAQAMNLSRAIHSYGRAVVTSNEQQQALARYEAAAAHVTALAVLANMRLAAQAGSVAWTATAAQFEAVTHCPAPDLGTAACLDDKLDLCVAIAEWRAFETTIRDFVTRALVGRPVAAPRMIGTL